MSGEQWGEAVRGIRELLRGAAPGPWRASYDEVNGYWVVGGSAAGEVAEVYGKDEALLLCAARNLFGPLLDERELIVADTRRKVAEEIEASADGYDGSYVDGLYQAAAIARGSGNGASDTSKPTGAQPI